MKPVFIFILSLIVGSFAFAVERFDTEQLTFKLFDSDGSIVRCTHQPLENKSPAPAPPWWTVECRQRTYVVDVWMDQTPLPEGERIQLMVHGKESVSSSGEKLVRFDSHLTSFVYEKSQRPLKITSNLDVRNGLADLRVEIDL